MQRNFIKECKVCGAKENVYYHFGVCTCRACGAFFRRYLENKNEWKYNICKCSKKNKDENSQPDLTKCKKCRLDKCLSAGMKRLGIDKLIDLITVYPKNLPISLQISDTLLITSNPFISGEQLSYIITSEISKRMYVLLV
uniref:Nuclear receptor domain-containing protein n=1 Tax=Meloidogyne incognita TaxID=6306 RepID=A0A914LG85_MELIC